MADVLGVRISQRGWRGVDLDGTLSGHGPDLDVNTAIGAPIPKMVQRVQAWLQMGYEVRVVTARVSSNLPKDYRHRQQSLISAWTKQYIGTMLFATAEKDFNMIDLWDDRAVRVEHNSGRFLGQDGWE